MNQYLDNVMFFLREYAYGAIFVALLLENTLMLGVIIPGVSVLILAGFLCSLGELNFGYCLIAGVAGTIVGDNISFLFGRFGAERIGFVRRMLERNPGILARIRSLNRFVLFFFHFPGYLRMGLPAAMGASGYDFRKWIAIDVVGAILFNFGILGTGYLIAQTTGLFTDASNIANSFQTIFAVFFAIWLVLLFRGYLHSLLRRRQETALRPRHTGPLPKPRLS